MNDYEKEQNKKSAAMQLAEYNKANAPQVEEPQDNLRAVKGIFLATGFGVLFFLALLSTCARADVGGVILSPYSFTQHYGPKGYCPGDKPLCEKGTRKKFENSHPSLGVEYQDAEDKSVAAGVYRDSYGGTSVYLARHWRYAYGLGATTGVLLGENYLNGFVPFVGPEITIQVMSVKVSLAYLPSFGIKNAPSLGVLQVAVKVW